MAARIIRNTENTEASDLSKSYFSTDKPRKMALTWGFTMCKTRHPPGSLERQAQWEVQGEHPEVETKIGGHMSLNAIFRPVGLRSTRGRCAAHINTSVQRGIDVLELQRPWQYINDG